jgi:BirA family biotin operon repressor/biotin-[acetyl-CoA-carboxylase] ligase
MDFRVIHIEETDSTNRWLKENGEGTMVVMADYQTAGKGCGTNAWESERGKNLTFSMLIHPDGMLAKDQFHITEVVSVAMCKTLQSYIHNKVEIKWPNDIYVGDRKICGILIENRLQGQEIKDCIIGIGLNVNQTEFKSDAPNPVSLRQLTGKETDINELLTTFLECFDRECKSKTTCFTYREILYKKGKDSLYKSKTTCFTARLMDVLPDGRLLLVDKEGQERTYAFKEVQFIVNS